VTESLDKQKDINSQNQKDLTLLNEKHSESEANLSTSKAEVVKAQSAT